MKIGLLPLYIQLYDETSPEARPRLESFYEEIIRLFSERNVEVEKSAFCRKKHEFANTIHAFEHAKVDAIVTLHMAYSPSLESIEELSKTTLPIIVLDTTPTLEFTPQQDPGEVMFNHGVHGVMDMCSMLRRYGKEYAIVAGHYLESDCINRACGYIKAAAAATALKHAKVGLIGGAFDGMGDFAVSPNELSARFNICVETIDPKLLGQINKTISVAEMEKELAENQSYFDFSDNIVEEEYLDTVRSCIALRKCIEKNGYTAFSVNFLSAGLDTGIHSMPFLECCKALERGIGYAGEGDALTAAFTGAFLSAYPETNFVEIFCPDWKNNMLFLSHMGETNYRIADCKPLICRTGTNFTKGSPPYVGYTRMKAGGGVYVNICRDKSNYRLFLAEAEMLSCDEDRFTQTMRGWMRPKNLSTAQFLEEHSKMGAIHHSIFVYGATVDELMFFGQLLSMEIATV